MIPPFPPKQPEPLATVPISPETAKMLESSEALRQLEREVSAAFWSEWFKDMDRQFLEGTGSVENAGPEDRLVIDPGAS